MDTVLTLAEIRARLVVIESELFGEHVYTRTTITSPNCNDLNRMHEQRFAALSKERRDLLAMLPPTGMLSGQRILITKVLGSIDNWPEAEPDAGQNTPVDLWDWSEA